MYHPYCRDLKEQIALVHPELMCGIVPPSLMGLAGWPPIFGAPSQQSGQLLPQLLDQVRTEKQRLRDCDPECLCGIGIDHQLERSRLQDRQIGWLGTVQDLAGVDTCLSVGNRRSATVCNTIPDRRLEAWRDSGWRTRGLRYRIEAPQWTWVPSSDTRARTLT